MKAIYYSERLSMMICFVVDTVYTLRGLPVQVLLEVNVWIVQSFC